MDNYVLFLGSGRWLSNTQGAWELFSTMLSQEVFPSSGLVICVPWPKVLQSQRCSGVTRAMSNYI